MAGIGPAIKTTGISGGTNNSAKPGDVNANKNNKLSALKISNISDKEKAIEKGEDPDATAEVAKDDKQNTGSTTTKKDSAEKDAKNATQTPRERLVGHIEEMNKTLQKFQEENNGKIAEAQAFGQQAQQNKAAEEMAKMMAMQQAQQPKQETPKAPTPSQSKPSNNNSSNEAVKKLAEQQKEVNAKQQEQMQKLAEALKKEKAKNDSPEEKLKDTQKALEAKKTKEADTDETKRSGSTDKALEGSDDKKTPKTPFTEEQKFILSKLIGEVRDLNPSEQKDILNKLNKFSEADSTLKPIEEKAKEIVDSKPNSSVDEASVKEKTTRSDLENYDENSFNLDFQSRSDDVNEDLERDTDKSLNEVAQDTTETIEQHQEEIEEVQEEQADQQAQEELDALLEQINIDVEE